MTETELKQAYAASVAAKINPEAVFIPLDILNKARKNYVLTKVIDEINTLARMEHQRFKESEAAGAYKTAFNALQRAKIAANQTTNTEGNKP